MYQHLKVLRTAYLVNFFCLNLAMSAVVVCHDMIDIAMQVLLSSNLLSTVSFEADTLV